MSNPDLPGDAQFRPASTGGIVDTTLGPAWVSMIPLSVESQAAIHHNQLRYAELGKLRSGRPNLYEQTRYRSY